MRVGRPHDDHDQLNLSILKTKHKDKQTDGCVNEQWIDRERQANTKRKKSQIKAFYEGEGLT